MKLPASEFLPRVSKLCFEEWQDIWKVLQTMDFTPSIQLLAFPVEVKSGKF